MEIGAALKLAKNGVLPVVENVIDGKITKSGKLLGKGY